MQILRQAARGLVRRPGFSLLIILIMALCIGGNASTFSAAKAVLFQKLPYQDPDRLVIFNLVSLPTSADNDLSWVEVGDWVKRLTLTQEISPFLAWQDRILMEGASVERIGVNFVTSSYLKLLGVKPALGRIFSPQEDGAPGSAPVIILGNDLWRRRFGADPGVVGRKIQLSGRPYTVIGVLPSGFYDSIHGHFPIDAWIPAAQAGEAFTPGNTIFQGRAYRYWYVLARLKPGATFEQAQKEIDVVAAQFRKEFPETNREYGARIFRLRPFMFEDLYPGMKVLLAGAIFVLLIGCANIANLLLVRLAERQRELSLRLTLGSGPWRLVQYVLAESLILAVVGGALGLLLAVWGTKVLASLVELPPFVTIQLDSGVLTAAAVVTLLTGFLFGLPPALSIARMDATGSLQQIRAAGGGRTHSSRSRSGLLVFQVAVVVVLLVVAGLLLRSFMQLHATGVDFNTERLLTVRMAFEGDHYAERSNIPRAERELLRRLEAVPGVERAAIWGFGMPGIDSRYYELKPEGAAASDPTIRADSNLVSPGTLKMIGVPLLRGRDFSPDDTLDKPRVVLVTQSLGQAMWPGQDPIGKRLLRDGRENETPWTVVGVFRDSRFQGRLVESKNHALFCYEQLPATDPNLLVRTRIDPGRMAAMLRDVVRQVDPQIPLYDVSTLEQRLWNQEAGHRLNAVIVSGYSAIALILAIAGLYGMLAYSVVQRTKEIGVRMALGAGHQKVVGMVMTRALLLVGVGLVLGLAGALGLTRLMSTLLFGVTARDPLTLVTASLLFVVIAVLATYLPARRATKVEPTIALRFE
jgi:putative ABC transport system permease protein